MMRAFTTGDEPDCQEITMDTIDIHNEKSTETNYVALSDIKDMDPCLFQNGVNPVTNNKCSEAFTGTSYPYYKYINSPSKMGMSGKGSLNALGKDIDGLMNYVQLLVEGTGGASATGQPLGNKYFLKTMGKCTDT